MLSHIGAVHTRVGRSDDRHEMVLVLGVVLRRPDPEDLRPEQAARHPDFKVRLRQLIQNTQAEKLRWGFVGSYDLGASPPRSFGSRIGASNTGCGNFHCENHRKNLHSAVPRPAVRLTVRTWWINAAL